MAEGDRLEIYDGDTGRHLKPTIWQKVKPGDKCYVRETWGDLTADHPQCKDGRKPQAGDRLVFRANPADDAQWVPGHPGCADFTWRPSIHMPRWASRLTLIVTATKMERVQEISYEDCRDEGTICPIHGAVRHVSCSGLRRGFEGLWRSLHTKPGHTWDENPEVCVISFSVHRHNIDQMPGAA